MSPSVRAVPRKWYGSADVTLYTLSIYRYVHKQVIRTIFEAHIVHFL
jgi:hypothetical protein